MLLCLLASYCIACSELIRFLDGFEMLLSVYRLMQLFHPAFAVAWHRKNALHIRAWRTSVYAAYTGAYPETRHLEDGTRVTT